MIYENKEEALKSRERFIFIPDNDPIFNKHYKRYGFYEQHDRLNHRNFGMYFLYELAMHSSDLKGTKLHYPKLGLYINELPCDQTTEVEWIDYRRTWEWRTEYKYTHNDKEYNNYICDLPTEIQRLPIWFDGILVYGAWNTMPNWQQLKQAYERTWWFYRTEDEKRDIQLNRLLK